MLVFGFRVSCGAVAATATAAETEAATQKSERNKKQQTDGVQAKNTNIPNRKRCEKKTKKIKHKNQIKDDKSEQQNTDATPTFKYCCYFFYTHIFFVKKCSDKEEDITHHKDSNNSDNNKENSKNNANIRSLFQ